MVLLPGRGRQHFTQGNTVPPTVLFWTGDLPPEKTVRTYLATGRSARSGRHRSSSPRTSLIFILRVAKIAPETLHFYPVVQVVQAGLFLEYSLFILDKNLIISVVRMEHCSLT